MEEGCIKTSEEFYTAIKKAYEKLGIEENSLLTKTGEEITYIGHPEVKGVKGIDKRKYLFDLIHLFPRDLNFTGKEDLGCLLRPELLALYTYLKTDDHIQKTYGKEFESYNKELDELNKNYNKVPNYKKSLDELLAKRKELMSKIKEETLKDIGKIKYNNCIGTNVVFADNVNTKEKLKKDEDFLNELAAFVKNNMVDEYLKRYSTLRDDIPYDSKTLIESIHKYGINSRYYGEIINRIESKQTSERSYSWLKSLIISDIIVRSASHIFDDMLKKVPSHLVNKFISYFLNIFLGSAQILKVLENLKVNFKNGMFKITHSSNISNTTNQEKETHENEIHNKSKTNDKTKKKKDKKKAKRVMDLESKSFMIESLSNVKLTTPMEFDHFDELLIKPSALWDQICLVSQTKYGFKLLAKNSFEFIDGNLNKYGLLRDFCMKVGLQLEAFDYQFNVDINEFSKELKYEFLTFQSEHIVNMYPVIKEIELPSEQARNIAEQAETLFNYGNLYHALEKFNQTALIYEEVKYNFNFL